MVTTKVHLEHQQVTMEVVEWVQTAPKDPTTRHIIFVHLPLPFQVIIQAMEDQEETIPIRKIVCPLNLKVAQAIQVL